MSELLNKYDEQHEKLIDLLVEYHNCRLAFMVQQSRGACNELKSVLRNISLLTKDMRNTVHERKKERSAEWQSTHRLKKEDQNE
jgi:hypothetical protein